MRVDHEIFHTPNSVSLSITSRAVPESYSRYAAGSELAGTMPMWRVQTEGYLDEKGMLVGVVAKNIDDGPDGEFIASGENSKGPDAMAIGRQGSYLHWGFAASPTYMTDEAKLVFINAIHYISKFEGQRAFERTESVLQRDYIDSIIYQLSDEGAAAWKASMAKMAEEHEKRTAELRKLEEDGEELTEFQKAMMNSPAPTWERKDALKRIPDELRERLGEDSDAYVNYFEENLPYFYGDPDEWYGSLIVDEDAKELGIPNNDLSLLTKCIELLKDDPKHEPAQAILRRYTNANFQSAQQWSDWLDERREYLVFSESSGYKFILDVNHAIADGKQGLIKQTPDGIDNLQQQIDEINVDAPEGDQPATFTGAVVPLVSRAPNEASRFRVIVKFKIMEGWHLYANVPGDEAYIPTTIKLLDSKGVVADDEWSKSVATQSIENPELMIWENECAIYKDITVKDGNSNGKQLELTVSFQVCDENSCMRPTTEKIFLTIE